MQTLKGKHEMELSLQFICIHQLYLRRQQGAMLAFFCIFFGLDNPLLGDPWPGFLAYCAYGWGRRGEGRISAWVMGDRTTHKHTDGQQSQQLD